jgi:hypothetical protein
MRQRDKQASRRACHRPACSPSYGGHGTATLGDRTARDRAIVCLRYRPDSVRVSSTSLLRSERPSGASGQQTAGIPAQ